MLLKHISMPPCTPTFMALLPGSLHQQAAIELIKKSHLFYNFLAKYIINKQLYTLNDCIKFLSKPHLPSIDFSLQNMNHTEEYFNYIIQDKKDQLTMKLYLQNSTENLKNITLLFISRVFNNSIEQNIGNLSSFKGPILIKHLNISNDIKKKCENFLFKNPSYWENSILNKPNNFFLIRTLTFDQIHEKFVIAITKSTQNILNTINYHHKIIKKIEFHDIESAIHLFDKQIDIIKQSTINIRYLSQFLMKLRDFLFCLIVPTKQIGTRIDPSLKFFSRQAEKHIGNNKWKHSQGIKLLNKSHFLFIDSLAYYNDQFHLNMCKNIQQLKETTL